MAADSIIALASLSERFIESIREQVASWPVAPHGVWLFGSLARGTAGPESDVDLLVVPPREVSFDDNQWRVQLRGSARALHAASGNDVRFVEFSEDEFAELFASGEPLAQELRRDAIALTPRRLPVRVTPKGGA